MADLADAKESVRAQLLETMTSVMETVGQMVSDAAPGRIAETVRVEQPYFDGTSIIGVVAVDSDVAQFVDAGTVAHLIFPRTAKALSWQGAAHPDEFVLHPGAQARNFFSEPMPRYFADALGQWFG